MRKILLAFSAIIVCTFFTNIVFGQVSLTTMNTAVTENFDGMASSGTATLPTGFKIGTDWATGTTATTLAYGTTGTGAVTGTSGGGVINWANGITASATDRSLGFLNTGSFTSPRSVVLRVTNNTGSTITALAVAFDFEKSRSGTRAFNWTFFHGSSSSPSTAETAGDQSYASDANNTVISNPPLTTPKSFTITNLAIANGTDYYLRWTFTGVGGSTNGQGIGIDNFSITPSDPLEIVTTNTLPNGDVGVAYPNPIVAAGGVAPYTYAVTGGGVPTGLTLNPNGTWSGSPTTSGTYGFDVQVTDSNPFTNVSNLKYNPIAKFAPTAPNTKTESFIVTINVPTAAGSLVKGRLLTSNGRGLSNALVVLTDSTTGETRTIRSSAFGHFTFEDCATGHFYILEVQSKKYMFNQQTFTLNGDLTDLVLTAQ